MSISSQSGVFGLARQGGAGVTAKGPYNSTTRVSEVQTISASGTVSGGTYTITFDGQTTAAIAYNASAATIQAALEALSNIEPGDVTVSGGPLPGTAVTVTFTGRFAGVNVPLMTIDSSNLTGTTPSYTAAETTPGQSHWYWLPALNVAFQPNQITQTIPPEVGGSLWARGSYKGGVFGAGNVTFVPRGGLGLAELFHAFCGGDIISGTNAGDYASGTINKLIGNGSNGLPAGVFKYRFVPDKVPGAQLPWYTFVRNVGGKFVEEFGDGRLGSFGFDMTASNILQIEASFVSKSCSIIALTAGGTGNEQVGKQIAGNGPVFQMVDAVVKLDSNVAGSPGPLVQNVSYNPTRLNIAFTNELTQNEFVVGSYFLQDVTNISRSAQITYGLYLRDAEIYSRVYAHGNAAADGSTGASWNSEIWKGKLNVYLISGANIPGQSIRYQLTIDIPELDYLAAPISLQGNQLVEYQLSANVVLSQNTSVDPFSWEYVTDEDIS